MRRAATILTAAMLAMAAPVSAKVASSDAGGFVTQHTADVAATPMATWLELIRPADWWNDSHTWSGDAANLTLTPQAGGCFCERVPGEDRGDGFSLDGSVQHMEVVQAYPLKALRLRGGLGPLQGEPATGVLTITLQEIDGGTRIRWEYVVGGYMRHDVPTIAKAVDAVMGQQLEGLRDRLGPQDEGADDAEENPEPADIEVEEDLVEDTSVEAGIDALQDDQ